MRWWVPLLGLTVACAGELDLPWRGEAPTIPVPHGFPAPPTPSPSPTPPATAGRRTWHSWDLDILPAGPPYAVVMDTAGTLAATVLLYEASSATGVGIGLVFDRYRTDDASMLEHRNPAGGGSGPPFVGKNATPRGMGDSGAPLPLGVYDLQMQSDQSDLRAVVAFVVPTAGDYAVSGLAYNRLEGNFGDGTEIEVFAPDGTPVASALADFDGWVLDGTVLLFPGLVAGDRLHFTAFRVVSNGNDATEVAFTITADQ